MSERMEEQLEKELDKFSGKDLTNQSLETVYKLAKSYYYLVAARKMNEDSGYSEAYYRDGNYGYGYDRGNDRGYSERRRRDSMGRYTRDSGESSYRNDGRMYSKNYSGHNDMETMLQDMMDQASDPKERETIQKMMSQMGR